MFDALTKLFEGKNINWKMTLRSQLKNVKIQNEETIQSYFTRVSQIKEQLEVVDEEVDNVDIVMTPYGNWTQVLEQLHSQKLPITHKGD